MAVTDFEVDPGLIDESIVSGFSSNGVPGQPAAACPLLAAGKGSAETGIADATKESKGKIEAQGAISSFDDPDLSAAYKWVDVDGAAKKFGDDKNNFQLGSYAASLSSGVSKVEGGFKADLISGSAEVAGAKLQGEKDFFGGAAAIKGTGEFLSAKATGNIGAEFSATNQAIEAAVGVEGNIAKAGVGGEIHSPLPWNYELIMAGGIEGQVGAAASASVGGGRTDDKGYFLEGAIKAVLGIGGGANFSIGVRERDKDG